MIMIAESKESMQVLHPTNARAVPPAKPVLIVFIENAGRVAGVDLPRWASQLLDWSTEEYGKLAVRIQARRHYREIVFLEDQHATASQLLRVPLISMSMGAYGSLSRMMGWVYGSTVTFAVGQSSSAPGQVPIEELRSVLDTVHRAMSGGSDQLSERLELRAPR